MIEFHADWYCPNCGLRDQSVLPRLKPGDVATRLHHCPKLGMTAPLVRQGTKAKVEAHVREDYIGNDIVQTNDAGRPMMNITTTRDDGQDVVVFAPTATAKGNI